VIVNLQTTRLDKHSDLTIHAYLDSVLVQVCKELGVVLPVWTRPVVSLTSSPTLKDTCDMTSTSRRSRWTYVIDKSLALQTHLISSHCHTGITTVVSLCDTTTTRPDRREEHVSNSTNCEELKTIDGVKSDVCLDGVKSDVCLVGVKSDVCLDGVKSDVCLDGVKSDVCLDGVKSDVCLDGVKSDVYLDGIKSDVCLDSVKSAFCLDGVKSDASLDCVDTHECRSSTNHITSLHVSTNSSSSSSISTGVIVVSSHKSREYDDDDNDCLRLASKRSLEDDDDELTVKYSSTEQNDNSRMTVDSDESLMTVPVVQSDIV